MRSGQSALPSTPLPTSGPSEVVADSPLPEETLSPSVQVQTSAASTQLDRPSFPTNLSTISASARTSYTRVDLSAMEIDTPSRVDGGGQDRDTTEAVDGAGAETTQVQPGGVESVVPDVPQVSLTFLLVSGRRRTMSFEQEMTVGRVKELVWNAWPNEWQDERPPAPSFLRILYLGKILQDDDTLTKVGFASYTPFIPPGGNSQGASRPSTPPPSTIVHLSIRAYAPPTQDAPKKKSRRQRQSITTGSGDRPGDAEDDAGSPGCCCTIC